MSAIIPLLFFLGSTSMAADIVGSWAGTFETPGEVLQPRCSVGSKRIEGDL